MPTYTVGTWARDRDCLWNIAKKPKIYDNPFLWPKIWQGNRDQIKNPDVIHKGQKLKIPPKADLTKEEKSALRKYWSKKNAQAAQQSHNEIELRAVLRGYTELDYKRPHGNIIAGGRLFFLHA